MDSADLGRLNKIIVGHDNTWLGAGWFLDKVIFHLSSTMCINSKVIEL